MLTTAAVTPDTAAVLIAAAIAAISVPPTSIAAEPSNVIVWPLVNAMFFVPRTVALATCHASEPTTTQAPLLFFLYSVFKVLIATTA